MKKLVGAKILPVVRRLKQRYVDKFYFIHISKTAGTSITRALNIPFEHLTSEEKKQEVGQCEWSRRYTFAVVRNPWDRAVSEYHYRIKTGQEGMDHLNLSFKSWLRLVYVEKHPDFYTSEKFFMPQAEWVTDERGKLQVDRILRFEDLENEFKELCRDLAEKAHLPKVNMTKRSHYQDYYDDETIEIIRDTMAQDIDLFGYEFELK